MVSDERLELLRKSLESTDWDTLPKLYHEDMELRQNGPGGDVHKGLPAYNEYFRQLFEEVEYLWVEVDDVHAEGDEVLVYTQGAIRDKRTSHVQHVETGIVFSFSGSKVSLVEPFFDRTEAYERWTQRCADTESRRPPSRRSNRFRPSESAPPVGEGRIADRAR
jgi:ketosteroid isomerase-like protein